MKSHFPSITPPLPVRHKNVKISTATINSIDIEGFDMNELEEVVQSYKNKKATGPDGLVHPNPVDQVKDNIDTKTRQRYIQSPQILKTNLPTKPTPQNNGKTDC